MRLHLRTLCFFVVGILLSGTVFAYEEDTHFILTFVMLRSVGFTHTEALTVAAVDQGMDDSPGTVANGGVGGLVPHVAEEWLWHALDRDGKMSASGIVQRKTELFNIALTRSTAQDKLLYLGVFYHYQQDTWAHRHHFDGNPHSQNAFTTYNTPLGHARDGHQPDRPPYDPVCALLCLEDGIDFAKDFLKRGLGRQPTSFLANYRGLGGQLDNGWNDGRKGEFFNQLASDGSPASARRYLTDLIRAQINAYGGSSTVPHVTAFTADELSFDSAKAALQTICNQASVSLGTTINIPSKQDKIQQGFANLTTSRLSAAVPLFKNYVVRLKTGTPFGAGTDANVSLVLSGSLRTSPTFRLNPMIRGNAFENGDLNVVTFQGVQDLGDVSTVTVSHDNSGIGPGWFLEFVEVTVDGTTKRFNCHTWLDSQNGLSKTLR